MRILLLLIAASFAFSPRLAAEEKTGDVVKRGVELYKNGQYDEAIDLLSEVIKSHPEASGAYTYLGLSYREIGEFDKALAAFDEAIRESPSIAPLYLLRGAAFVGKGDYKQALASFNRALEVDPKYGGALASRGVANQELGNFQQALSDLEQALELYPNKAHILAVRGMVLRRQGRYAQAIAEYEKAIALDSKQVAPYNNYAWLLSTCTDASFRNGKRAIEYALKAGELSDWKRYYTYAAMAAAYADTGNFSEAISWQRRCLEFRNLSAADRIEGKDCLAHYEKGEPYRTNK